MAPPVNNNPLTPEKGAKMRRQRGARAAHKAIKAKGSWPWAGARAAQAKKRAERKAAAAAEAERGPGWTAGSANLDGV